MERPAVSAQEFSIALVSVILGLGLTDLLGNFNRLMRARGRVRWHPLPLAWALLALMLVINFWWGVYLGLVVGQQPGNAGEYLVGLMIPIALYLVCAGALPAEVPEAGIDLGENYFREHRYFFGLLLIYLLTTVLNAFALGQVPGWDRITLLRVGVLALSVALLVARAPWVHWVGTLLFLAIILARMFSMTARAGT